mmetsp:Transcript_131502/g.195929  ORF Transcript_131502/g.195929 Transcript_131502/m.195929 type:complete len:240 (+) Transcript_131502:225-944(+)
MCHGTFCNFDQHGKQSFLKRKTKIFSLLRLGQLLYLRQYPRKAHVHALYHVRKWNVFASLLGFLLNLVSRRRFVGYIHYPREPIETISNRNVNRLSKNTIPLIGIGNDLSISSTHVQDDGIRRPGGDASHFDVTDAMIHPHQGNVPQQGQGASTNGAGLERGSHTRAFGVANGRDEAFRRCVAGEGFYEGGPDESDDVILMVCCGLSGQEAFSSGCNVGLARICQDMIRCLIVITFPGG